jgi:signal peptidase I
MSDTNSISPDDDMVPSGSVESIKGITMAFLMALIFRAFIIEGFEIPTGSMAPTLLGQHTLMSSPVSGAVWPVGPRGNAPAQSYDTLDPMTGAEIHAKDAPLRGGDRVFILKYLWPLFTPSRYDVVVFKNPRDPTANYIKRLVGVGPEEVAIVDGDIFTRPIGADGKAESTSTNTWELAGWNIRRKGEASQRAMWQSVFDTRYTPVNPVRDGRAWFRSPWASEDKNWQIENRSEYRYEGSGATTLAWDAKRRLIGDYYPYNVTMGLRYINGIFPVSDVRVTADVNPDKTGQGVSFVLQTRGHEFRASIEGATVTLKMKQDKQDAWTTLGNATLAAPLAAGTVSRIEFWHVDQGLKVFIDGAQIASGVYEWTPAQRLLNAEGVQLKDVFENAQTNLLADPSKICQPKVSLEFSGGPFTLSRLAIDRDIYYQPGDFPEINDATPSTASGPHSHRGQPANATHPRQPLFLGDGEFFVCGDNSPASLDARLWDKPYSWSAQLSPKTGVVGRDAMIGRAFIVYWPGMYWKFGAIPLPDFGRMRQIK